MGTWGPLPLDNDTAADWCAELDDAAPSERPQMVSNALQYAIGAGGKTFLLDDTQVAIAAAAVVASQLEHGPVMAATAFGPDFILEGGSLEVAHLAPLAAQALNQILGGRASTWRPSFVGEIQKLRDILASSSGRPRPEVQWSAVATKGFSDRPAESDLLQRSSVIEVIADLLSPAQFWGDKVLTPEVPQVISIEGTWGSGKTSVMHLIADSLKRRASSLDNVWYPRSHSWWAWRHSWITPFIAHRLLSIWRSGHVPEPIGKYGPSEKYGSQPLPVVASFEPWAHQSSEQVSDLRKSLKATSVDVAFPLSNCSRK